MQTTERIRYITSAHVDKKPDAQLRYPAIIHWMQVGFKLLGPVFPRAFGNLAFRIFTTPMKRAKHKVSDIVMEKARLFEFMSGSHLLKGYEWGKGQDVVLLIHGWESRGTAMRSMVRPLVESGYKVVTFDAPAHGNSSGTRLNLMLYAQAVKSVINRYDRITHIVSHSFGGAAAMFALAHFDLKPVDKMVMTAAPSSMQTIFDNYIKMLSLPKSVQTAMLDRVRSIVKVPFDQMDGRDLEHKVKISDLLIIHDEKDPIVPLREAEMFIDKWSKGTLLVTSGFGHFRLLKNPDVIAEVTNFLAP